MSRTNEAFWWSLFSAGGVVAAFVIPVMIFLTGLSGALGWGSAIDGLAFAKINALFSNVLVKVFLWIAVSLPLFHCAHRIRHTLVDVGLKNLQTPLTVICYSGATVGTVLCATFLLRIVRMG